MSRVQLSIVIPARNEMFLSRTVRDIVEHKRGKTEILVGLDGAKADPLIDEHPDVTIVYRSESIGQRAMTNQLVRLSRAKYIMKLDAHCSVDEGFDVKMMGDMQDHWTMVPVMKNFHVFDWVCKKCGDRRYQGPTPTECPKCDNKTEFERDIVWIAKNNPQSTSYCFDSEPHFQYFREFKGRPEYKKSLGEEGLTETMSLQGSCWMVTRDKYWELDLCDETWENWGSQGIQVAVSTWLSGGRVVCNLKTWYSHMFRSQGGNFSFPWPCSGRQVQRAKKHARDLFYNNKFPKQIYPSSWLLDKFWVVPGWNDEARAKITEAGVTFMNLRNKVRGVLGVVSTIPSPVTDHTSSVSSLVGRREQVSVPAMSQPGLPGDNLISGTTVLSDVGTSPTLTVGSTDSTDTKRRTVGKVSHGGQEVSSGAVSFGTVDGRNSIGGTEVINLQSQSEMERITTSPIITDNMINNGNASGVTHRDGSDKPGVSQSVHSEGVVVSDRVGETFEVAKPISILVETPPPVPAPSDGVNLNLGKNSGNVFTTEGIDGKIIGSHLSYLPKGNENRLESGECLNHSPDSTIIPPTHSPVKATSSPSRGIVYYSDSQLDPAILEPCQKQLLRSTNGYPIISVTLKPIDFGKNIVLPLKRSHLSMARQQLAGLEASTADIIFLCEHDCLYPKKHFEFVPPRKDVFFYNLNWVKVRTSDGQSLHFTAKQVSGLCAYRDILLDYYRKRVSMIESGEIGGRRHFEPGSHYRDAYNKLTSCGFDTWYSEVPYVDIRHDKTVTRNIFDPSGYKNQVVDWTLCDEIPFWGKTKGRFWEFLREAVDAL